jgi:hypothetical protein
MLHQRVSSASLPSHACRASRMRQRPSTSTRSAIAAHVPTTAHRRRAAELARGVAGGDRGKSRHPKSHYRVATSHDVFRNAPA